MATLRSIHLWFERLWFAQHNARVLADMEWRMILLVENATGGRMSKAYYSTDQMNVKVAANHNAIYQDGWDDALAEVSADLGPAAPPLKGQSDDRRGCCGRLR